MSLPIRRVQNEIINLLDKEVEVYTTYGKKYSGKVQAIEPDKLSIVLSNVKDDAGNFFSLLVLNGVVVGEIKLVAPYHDLKELADKLEKYFPRLVNYDSVSKVIIVADKVRVLADGTVEGSGPIADKVRAICSEFFKK
ncbi:MAG TPA: Lsm family RNA-binding protein [Geobacterales bacterium]|nr:Lsm family RNA-binding protein [Geobacterales bacterium]